MNTVQEGSGCILRDVKGRVILISCVSLDDSPYSVGHALIKPEELVGKQFGVEITPSIEDLKKQKKRKLTPINPLVEDEENSEELDSSVSRPILTEEKYQMKKMLKQDIKLTILPLDMWNVINFYITVQHSKIGHLRWESLRMLLSLGNVCTGKRVMTVDQSGGLLSAATLTQLSGNGELIFLETKGVSDVVLQELRLKEDLLKSRSRLTLEQVSVDPKKYSFPEEDLRSSTLKNLLEEGIDCFVSVLSRWRVSSVVEMESQAMKILDASMFHLVPGGRICVFCHHLDPLKVMTSYLRDSNEWIRVEVTETFAREYKVAPNVTHPDMSSDLTLFSGFTLSAIRVESQ
eukprot:GHVP01036800.1.p1 GENE.GHVP01036800.1~~GHVP01036800.1.p1  ORF type:complete len:347 (-),score=64.54 GHVP01036800.1:1172-2212(-)